jgi:hypothetical protein
MTLRKRSYVVEIGEMTTSGAVPTIIKPLGVLRRAMPAQLLMRILPKRKKKKRILKRLSKQFSPPLPPKI